MKNKEPKKKKTTNSAGEAEKDAGKAKDTGQDAGDTKDSSDADYITMDMPEVKDIPGQEKIRPPKIREMMDITPSSADEEGEGLLDDLNREDVDDDIVTDKNSNVSASEKRYLRKTNEPESPEEEALDDMTLNSTDGQDELNEKGKPRDMGIDLDVPGAELDDAGEDIGEEDEENNAYSDPDT